MSLVKDVLNKKGDFVATVPPDISVLQAAREMNDRKVGALVVTHAGKVEGMFSERDILTRVFVPQLEPDITHVEQVMTRQVTFCHPDMDTLECKRIMTIQRIRHLPVVEQERLIGIITTGDLMAQEIREQSQEIEYLNHYISGSYH